MESDPFDPQTALNLAADDERRAAQVAVSTTWYAPWYGATTALLPLAGALIGARNMAAFVVLALMGVSLATLVSTYRRITGVWPSSAGLVWYMVLASVLVLVATLGSMAVAWGAGLGWWIVPVMVVTGATLAWLSRRFDAAYASRHGA